MTTTKLLNHLYYMVCMVATVLAAVPESYVVILPPKAKPWFAGAALGAAWLKGHWNLFVNPDGTPAHVAYIPAEEKKNA